MPFSTAYRLLAVVLFSLSVTLVSAQSQPFDTLRRIAEDEYRRLVDPALDTIPYERLEAARQQLRNRPAAQTNSAIPNVMWQERGPSNIAGRTRALMFDLNDPARKKVWAGSLSGGLWYTNDITDANATWTPVSDTWENTVITALAADPSNPQVMYAGTGDTYDGLAGGGIWKTTNGGVTWTRLSSSIPGGNYPGVNQGLSYIQRIVVNSTGKVFVATRYGIVQSSNGGTSWSYALAPGQLIGVGGLGGNYSNDNVTDLEIGSDGILYAGFNPSRVFKSNDATGTSWTEITPPGSTGGLRTELALASSTSGTNQVIYGVSHAYNSPNFTQDLRWFKKSINGGASWTDIAVPVASSSSFFTNGNGYYNLALSVHPTDPNYVYAGGVYWHRSSDGGSTWSSALHPNSSSYQNLLLFQPGGTGVALSSNQGIEWSPDWGNNPQPAPTVINRNSGYRSSSFYSVAMKATPGNAYLVGGTRGIGTVKVPNPNLSTGSSVVNSGNDGGYAFVDEDDPTIQVLASYYGSYYLSNGNSWTYIAGTSATSNNPTEYDSQSNTLYAYDYVNGYSIRKITGIGGTTSSTTLPLSGLNNTPSFFKLSPDKQSLFVGTSGGHIYKVTNLNQTTPNVTSLSNNTYLQNGVVSCIDVGVDDNELLVTYSNFGVKSVWYTSTNGNIWLSKDEPGHGLPDIPVRYAIFNPQNRLQVLLATELGVWSTTDITSSNPDWAPTNNGIGNYRVNMLKYRPSDGRIAAATFGRGLYTTDAFAVSYTLPTIAITAFSNATLCAGNTFNVSFTTSGPGFGNGNRFDVWLSDANGNFTNAQKLSSGVSSPISVTLPSGSSAFSYGTNYRVKIIATNPEVESSISDALAIGNLTSAYVFDRRASSYGGATVCTGSSVRLNPALYTYNNLATNGADSYQWLLNDSPVSGEVSSTHLAQQAGVYKVIIRQAGCTVTSGQYNLSFSTSVFASLISPIGEVPQCADSPVTINNYYVGEPASFQWKRDNVDIVGATSYTYTANQTGRYSVRVVDGSCAVTSSPIYLQFGSSLYAHLAPPTDSLYCTGLNAIAYLNSGLSYGFNNHSIQWFRNGTAITTLAPLTSNNSYQYAYQSGVYSFVLKQGACETRSNSVAVSLVDQLKVSISYGFSSKAICSGETRWLYSSINNGSFQWQRDGVDIPGATNSGYAVTTSGSYTLRITRGSCSATSEPVSLTFSNTTTPRIQVIEACSAAYLSTNSNGEFSGYQYQWYRNGILVNGVTASIYYTSQSGTYTVRITNGSGGCTGLSKEVYVGTTAATKPIVNVMNQRKHLCPNNSIQLSATNYAFGNPQWKRNGVIIPNATSSPFYATQSGVYSVVTQYGSCQVESDPVEVKIGEPTTATLSGNAVVSAGQSAQLPVTFTGPAPWAFTLTNGQSVTATYQNPYLVSVTPTATTTYQLASVANACGLGATSGQGNVVVGTGSADVSLNMVVNNKVPKVGDVVTYTLQASNAGPDNAQGVQLKSVLPAGLAFVSSSSPGVSFANGVVSANLGTVNANSLSSISFDATPTQLGGLATSAQITASQTPDSDSQPNSGTGDGQDDASTIDIRTTDDNFFSASANPNQVPLPVVSGNQPTTDANTADLSLLAKVDKVTPVASELVTTTLTVSNRGGSSAASVVVQVVLPNGTFSSQSPAGWIQVNGQTYKAFINTLPAGKSATLSLKWQPAGSGTIQAQLIDADVADPDSTPGNGYQNGEDDEASASVKVR
ncbi:DUF11 domain-containing protein [Spirosoma sp. BT702]|uniref:DUF11 domain-containing protein n=1 Tax=Spirosoma profusum TaxID=2771354 RepID=A0A926XY72_9BACT|nr:DUF11 domain-containing protein [Spirosoma profusum]MBD2700232.1 DUF11 domain-containing protein [Spirosoma profusum]